MSDTEIEGPVNAVPAQVKDEIIYCEYHQCPDHAYNLRGVHHRRANNYPRKHKHHWISKSQPHGLASHRHGCTHDNLVADLIRIAFFRGNVDNFLLAFG